MGHEYRGVLLLVALTVAGVAADSVLKMASLQRSPFAGWRFALGCLFSVLFAVIWVYVMRDMKLATAGLIYAVASTLALVVVGVVVFDERLSPSEVTGVGMAMGSLVLLGRVAP